MAMELTIVHQHRATACDPDLHCLSCGVDEPNRPAYIYCGECFHVYPTARSLRKAYRRMSNTIAWRELRRPMRLPAGLPGAPRWPRLDAAWLWLRSRFRRAQSIYFCQECTHDF